MKLFLRATINWLNSETLLKFFLVICIVFLFGKSSISTAHELNGTKSKSTMSDVLFGNPPDANPIIFGNGIVTMKDRSEYGVAVSADYSEIFYTASGVGLMIMNKQQDGAWSVPKVANLLKSNKEEFEAFYSYDGSKVFFSYMIAEYDSRIAYVEKTSSGYSTAIILESPVNSQCVFWSTLTKDNTMYFTNFTQQKIYKSKFVDGKYKEITDIGLLKGSFHPFISPNEDFILFDLNGDINISFKQTDGRWGSAIKLNNQINSSYWESCASLSADGKYIFFTRYNDVSDKGDIYWAKIDDVIKSLRPVGVKENVTERPIGYSLNQNYPNPFNPSTTIKFNLPKSSHVLLKVFDSLGKEVVSLVNQYMSAGSYTAEWNAEGLTSGVYYNIIKAGEYEECRKLILLK